MSDLAKLPWVSISIGAEKGDSGINFELDFHSITTPKALAARREMGEVLRTLEQWDRCLRKMSEAEADRMGDRIQYDEKRRNI